MKAQGSLEYLLILAAILAIAVVVVVVANSMLNPAESAAGIQEDKYVAGLAGVELIGYTERHTGAYDGDWAPPHPNAPEKIEYNGIVYESVITGGAQEISVINGKELCKVGEDGLRLIYSTHVGIAECQNEPCLFLETMESNAQGPLFWIYTPA